MKKQLMTVMLALVALSTAQAKIGQTPQEVIQDARREKAVGVQWVEYLGQAITASDLSRRYCLSLVWR